MLIFDVITFHLANKRTPLLTTHMSTRYYYTNVYTTAGKYLRTGHKLQFILQTPPENC